MVKSGIFNSLNGDRVYNGDDLGEYMNGLLTDGLFKDYGSSLEVTTPGSVPLVVVNSGKASLLGKYIKNDGGLNVMIDAGGSSNRIDAVVVGVDLDERTADIYVKKGEESLVAQPPAMANTASKKEICLAYVYRPAGATSVSGSQITDKRGDEALCPYVKLTKGLTMEVSRSEVVVNNATNQVMIAQASFDASADTLVVYQNGLIRSKLTYTIQGTGSAAYIELNQALTGENTNTFVFLVYKAAM